MSLCQSESTILLESIIIHVPIVGNPRVILIDSLFHQLERKLGDSNPWFAIKNNTMYTFEKGGADHCLEYMYYNSSSHFPLRLHHAL